MPLMAVSTAPPHSFWSQSKPLSPSFSLSLPLRSRPELTLLRRYRLCRAAKQQQAGPSKKRPGKRKPSEKPASREAAAVEVVAPPARQSQPSSIPKPPAGFVLDPHGKVLLASSKRIATIVDAANNLPLECVIRRVFQSSRGDECMLLCPVDTPVQILKSTNFNGWSAVNDDEIEAIIPSAAYALAKIHMHLVVSGFCYTARGGFCYSEEDILEFGTDDGEDIDGLPTEGIEITCFHMDGAHYMIYAPSDPLLFVAVKDKNGLLQIADDILKAIKRSNTLKERDISLTLGLSPECSNTRREREGVSPLQSTIEKRAAVRRPLPRPASCRNFAGTLGLSPECSNRGRRSSTPPKAVHRSLIPSKAAVFIVKL